MMFKKLVTCLVIALLAIPASAIFAMARESITGVGVRGVQDPIDRIGRAFTRDTGIRIVTKEESGGVAIERIGKGVEGYHFGMITRELNDKERAAYPDVQIFEFARDTLAVIVHPANPVTGLTSAQLRDIFTGKIRNWADVGGPRGVISVFIREPGSGQRVAFEAAVMEGEAAKGRSIGSMGGMRADVAIDTSAIGYVLTTAVDKTVKALEVDGYAPTVANMIAGTYGISVPLYLITKGEPAGATKKFIDHLLSPAGQAAVKRERLAPVGPVQ